MFPYRLTLTSLTRFAVALFRRRPAPDAKLKIANSQLPILNPGPGLMVECPSCNGATYIEWDGHYQLCSWCHGTGTVLERPNSLTH